MVTLSKKIEEDLGIENTSVILFYIFEMLSRKPLKTWQLQMDKSNFLKILALLFVCMEKLGFTCSERELPRIYGIFGGSSEQAKSASPLHTLENSHKYYTWLWQGRFDEVEEVLDVIKLYPVFFRDIQVLNSLSKKLNIQNFEKLEENSIDRKEILLFFNILSAWFKKLADALQKTILSANSQVLKAETLIISENKKTLLEFLDRVS